MGKEENHYISTVLNYIKKRKPSESINFRELPLIIAVRTGLEPATPCVTGTYSNQLNYRTGYLNVRTLSPFVGSAKVIKKY